MTSEILTPSDNFLSVLHEAIAAFKGETRTRPTAEAVTEALLQAEKAAKHSRLTYPPEALIGRWRLYFVVTAPKPRHRNGVTQGKGFYLPQLAPAQIAFGQEASGSTSAPGSIGNQVQAGPLVFRLSGPARGLGKKNVLAFDFTQMHLSLFGKTLYQRPIRRGKAGAEAFEDRTIATLPFFAFFCITDQFIAARGRSGGLALWVREPDSA